MHSQIIEGLQQAFYEGVRFQRIAFDKIDDSGNRFCLFLKPGVMVSYPSEGFHKALDFMFSCLKRSQLKVEEIVILSSDYLLEHCIIQQHYNHLYAGALMGLRDQGAEVEASFQKAYGCKTAEACILGGYEFLERYSGHTLRSLDVLWENLQHKKLSRGLFVGRMVFDDEVIFLVNGFTPWQMYSYVRGGMVLLVFCLTGQVSWRKAREDFLGSNDPRKADPMSLRGGFFSKWHEWGLEPIRIAANGVHMSAGPVEALIEQLRFLSNYDAGHQADIADLGMGRRLLVSPLSRVGTQNFLERVRSDIQVAREVFNMTDMMDEEAALPAIVKYAKSTLSC